VIASLKGLPTVLQLQRVAGMTSLSKLDLIAACDLISKRTFSDAAFQEAFKGKEMAKLKSEKSVADALAPRSGKEAKETKETKSGSHLYSSASCAEPTSSNQKNTETWSCCAPRRSKWTHY
jgi:hypothetical protein